MAKPCMHCWHCEGTAGFAARQLGGRETEESDAGELEGPFWVGVEGFLLRTKAEGMQDPLFNTKIEIQFRHYPFD